jgi:DNA-binding beta-propeller fold protein YncE
VVFDLESHQVITSLKIGGGPDSVAYDGTFHRIYSAGKAGRLTVIQQDDPNTYRVLDEIRTHYGAHTLGLDPVSHRVFVAYASLFVHPRINVFSPTAVNDVRQMTVEGRSWLLSLRSRQERTGAKTIDKIRVIAVRGESQSLEK